MKYIMRNHIIEISILSALLLSGCATPEASIAKLETPLSITYHYAEAEKIASDEIEWWKNFNDPILTDLIEKGLNNNHDIRTAMTRITAADAMRDVQASRLLPTINLQASASKSRSGFPQAVKQGLPDIRAYNIGLGLDWEIDIGGGLRAAKSAAESDAMAAEYGVVGAQLVISSEIARNYFTLRAAQERLKLVEALAATQHESAYVVSRRYAQGQSSQFDLDIAEAGADTLDAQIPQLRVWVATLQSQIAVLVGENPSSCAVQDTPDYSWPKSQIIGVSQPSDLLRRRPDLMAAESHYSAESLRSKEAQSQTWPKLFVNALVGRQDFRINGLDLAPVSFSNVAAAFVMPIFNAGRIQAGIDAQNAQENEALIAWQKSVLTAVKEVEDSLIVQSEEIKRGEKVKAALNRESHALKATQSLYREGQIDKLTLLDIQRVVLGSKLALSDHELQRLLSDVQLYKALGGGWSSENKAKTVSDSNSSNPIKVSSNE
ncbi:efflux transporter outer membrane subunit [Sulfuricurvum sp.]|uniref:efflux transporter outer membrane subunit n=1 Tax=Sulfuricurvum sp. TaxID=2025608 RepID=UPI002E33D347|nr:efflux transporter outer membrane subunit [Sulfuricurvum sp.]HEX5329255.1 efflux transporter outer membrane subunit [Sulfuricurvum sp.]